MTLAAGLGLAAGLRLVAELGLEAGLPMEMALSKGPAPACRLVALEPLEFR